MKFATASVVLLPLFGLAAGQPSRHNHQAGSKRHDAMFGGKRDHIQNEGRAVVYVNQYGQQINKPSVGHAPVANPGNQGANVPQVNTPAPPAANDNYNPGQGAAASNTPVTTPQQPAAGNSTGGSGGNGVTYSPYKGNSNCKTQAEVDADFAEFAPSFGTIRLYGVDCDQIAMVHKALGSYSNQLFLGIFELADIAGQVQKMTKGLGGDWSRVDTVSVGNELVNNGGASVAQVVAALGIARSALRAAGFQGPVVIVDTFNAVIANPQICDASDYCAVNMHPFFDRNTAPGQAGAFMTNQLGRVRAALSDASKRIVVTETGWPWQGSANGLAVPGIEQQAAALQSIKGAFASDPDDVFLFTAFNDLWKKPEAATFNAEQFWGMAGRYSSADGGH